MLVYTTAQKAYILKGSRVCVFLLVNIAQSYNYFVCDELCCAIKISYERKKKDTKRDWEAFDFVRKLGFLVCSFLQIPLSISFSAQSKNCIDFRFNRGSTFFLIKYKWFSYTFGCAWFPPQAIFATLFCIALRNTHCCAHGRWDGTTNYAFSQNAFDLLQLNELLSGRSFRVCGVVCLCIGGLM